MKTIQLKYSEYSDAYSREAFNTLRTNILFSGKDIKSIVVTSCVAHEGKSTISVELSRSLAEAGKKVLLLDLDLRKSMLMSKYSDERDLGGMSQVLSGQIPFEDALCKTQNENFDVVFAGPFPPNPAELVGSPTLKEILDRYRDAYDYIILDAPPLGLVIDAAIMAQVCDGSVIVINLGHIKYRMAQDVKQQLEKSGSRILGVIMNHVDKKRKKNGGGVLSYYGYYRSSASGKKSEISAPEAVK